MSFLHSLYRAPSVALLFSFALTAAAQQCYYPDGTESYDQACSSSKNVTTCCPSNSYCMENGLCYGDGMLSRGSCTDRNWPTEQCGSVCADVMPSLSAPITPCSPISFTCGLNNTNCETDQDTFELDFGAGIALREDQVATIVSSALSTSLPTVTVTASATASATPGGRMYTHLHVVSTALGWSMPAYFISSILGFLLWREKRKHAVPKELMYLPPDNHDRFEMEVRNPAMRAGPDYKTAYDMACPATPMSISSPIMPPAAAAKLPSAGEGPFIRGNFFERYDPKQRSRRRDDIDRVELDVAPPYRGWDQLERSVRIELPSRRMSADSVEIEPYSRI